MRAYVECRDKKGGTTRFWFPAEGSWPIIDSKPPDRLKNPVVYEKWRDTRPIMHNKEEYLANLKSRGYVILAQGTIQ